jgi:formylglycine-generating enzyme required for sulfatase activity
LKIRRATAWTAIGIFVLATTAHAQLFNFETVTVPASDAQPGGPVYDYEIAVAEVTNDQYAAFLNDAELHNEAQNPGFGNERGANLKFRLPPFGGDVGLIVGDGSDVDSVFDLSRSLLTYDDALPVGQRFGVTPGKEDHPIVGASWIGAVKYSNWLTIDQGLGIDARCYAEGESELDWFPWTIGDEIGGTQQATNAMRDLTEAERLEWVTEFRGFRLPMDQGGTAVGAVNAVPRPYNEWYKAAAWDPDAPDFPRDVFPGFPFEEHTVPIDHWTHSFGRDPLTNADANYRNSGDPFDDPDPAVIATTPVGYYDGTDHGGVFPTTTNNNRYGIDDMSGNVWELLSDQVTITDSLTPDRALAGGSYRSNNRQVTSANRGDIGPGTTRPVVGFRVLRVAGPSCAPPVESPDLSVHKLGPNLQLEWSVLPDATAYDAVRGELGLLRSTSGDFNVATVECIADEEPSNSVTYVGDPPSGEAFWFLVRGADCGGGPYESGSPSQVGLRDPEIESSAGTCRPFPSYQIRVLARTGDEPPERPGEVFTTFTDPDLNDADQVIFKGNFDGPASGNEGLYLWDPTGEQLLRVVDDSFDSSPPGQSGATSWTSFGPPVLNESGHVLFHGNFSFGDNSQGLYVFTDTNETVIFDDNPTQPVPGQPAAQGFTVFPFSAGVLPLLSDGDIGATVARFLDPGFVEREGVYKGDSVSGIVQVADETLSPPGQPASTFETFDWFMATNGSGDVALHAEYTNGGHGMYRFVHASQTLLRVADTRLVPPGQSSPSSFSLIDGSPSMNDSGTVAFRASYANGNGNQGIYQGSGVGPAELVVDNSDAFDVPAHPGASFLDFGLPALNAGGDIVFSATHTAGFGIYRASGETLTAILDSGDAVPHQPGATFFALGSVSASAQGNVAFTARYSGGSGDEGLYLHDGANLRRVIDESDTSLGLTITNLHMLVTTGQSGGEDGKPNALSSSGSIAFRAQLTGGEEAVLLAIAGTD